MYRVYLKSLLGRFSVASRDDHPPDRRTNTIYTITLSIGTPLLVSFPCAPLFALLCSKPSLREVLFQGALDVERTTCSSQI